MKYIHLFSIIAFVSFFSCKAPESKEVITLNEDLKIDTSVIDVSTENDNEPQDDLINEFGLLTGIEDGGYPMHILSVEFPERKMSHDFTINVEAGIISFEELIALQGKYISISYTSEFENMLYDLQYNGASTFGEYAPENVEGLSVVKGKLTGAEYITQSDLPSTIAIVEENGDSIKFEYYIDDEMVKANNKIVSAYYDIRTTESILGIKGEKE